MGTREPILPAKDIKALEEMIEWVKRSRDQAELMERIKGMQAFVELHPRLREAAMHYRAGNRA